MSARFEELDWRPTPIGAISLRRRRDPGLGVDVYEIKLDDDFLMSSLFTAGEIALARLGLAGCTGSGSGSGPGSGFGSGLDVVVGGLGLGYTAQAVLEDRRVGSLVIVEALAEVIEWHDRGLLPLSERLTADPRCRMVNGDFFAMATAPQGLDPERSGAAARFHAVLVDIDHSPRHVLHPGHAAFYGAEGLRGLAGRLHPGGVFALWSNDPPDGDFTAALGGVFDGVETHVVDVPHVTQAGGAANTVYVARLARSSHSERSMA